MSVFKRIFGKKPKPGTLSFKLIRAQELHGQPVKYVTEHVDDNEDVVGRGGAMCVKGDEFIIDSSGERLFVVDIKDMDANYLMSGDGVIITGPNKLQDGKIRTLTVHFVYYRK